MDKMQDSDLYLNDTCFKVVRGLSGTESFVSFESVNNQGHYLRHSETLLFLHKQEYTEAFAKDASFKIINHKNDQKMVKFESESCPRHYIR